MQLPVWQHWQPAPGEVYKHISLRLVVGISLSRLLSFPRTCIVLFARLSIGAFSQSLQHVLNHNLIIGNLSDLISVCEDESMGRHYTRLVNGMHSSIENRLEERRVGLGANASNFITFPAVGYIPPRNFIKPSMLIIY